jgi:hypothetical protein
MDEESVVVAVTMVGVADFPKVDPVPAMGTVLLDSLALVRVDDPEATSWPTTAWGSAPRRSATCPLHSR